MTLIHKKISPLRFGLFILFVSMMTVSVLIAWLLFGIWSSFAAEERQVATISFQIDRSAVPIVNAEELTLKIFV